MIDTATLILALRGLHLAAGLSMLGTAGFMAWILPPASPGQHSRTLLRLCRRSGMIAILAGAAWFAAQAAAIADAGTQAELVAALPVVALHTRFGNILMLRLGLLLAATVLLSDRPVRLYLTLLLTAAGLSLQGEIGHAGAAAGQGLVLSEALHVLAAGLWLGALIPLFISLKALPQSQAPLLCERFSPIGLGCVLVLACTGFLQAQQLVGGFAVLFGTPYGLLVLLKITLFLLTLILAAANRLWLTDRIADSVPGARRQMQLSVALETCLGLAVIGAAAALASTMPAAHSTPVWPFSWQFSMNTVNEDPDFRQEVAVSLAAIGSAVLVLVVTLLWGRFRLLALAILALTIVLRAPSLTLLTAEAYPTSFQTSPTGFTATSIVRGQTLYGPNCSVCHGANGQGDGPAAAALRIKPADLTMPHIRSHTDGEMFWWLTHGIDDPEGGLAMPGFATSLTADDRWALIDYVRAHNAGISGSEPIQAPEFPVNCAGIAASGMHDLRGQAVYVSAKAVDKTLPRQAAVRLVLGSNDPPDPGSCTADDPSALKAYAVLAAVPPDHLADTAFLIDPNGWVRVIHKPGEAGGWQTSEQLIAAIANICAHPYQQASEAEHEHHH